MSKLSSDQSEIVFLQTVVLIRRFDRVFCVVDVESNFDLRLVDVSSRVGLTGKVVCKISERFLRVVSLQGRVRGRGGGLRGWPGFRPHPCAQVDRDGVLLDVDEAGVDDLAVDLHHQHVVRESLHAF